VANGFKYPTAFGLLHYAETESFPNFRSGNVFIMTDLVHPRKAWQLHLSTLERHASFFALALRKHVDCGGYNGQWLYFLVAEEGGKMMLVEQVRGGDQLTFGYGTSRQDPLGGHVLIKVEDAEAGPVSQEVTVSIPNDKHQDVVDAYDQIFGAFYNIPLRIPLHSIEAALEVSEQLVNIACDMGCIALVESHIGNALLQFRQALFVAIKADPPRWLKLAFHLKNDSIYTEALIHLVGAHPCWPWSTTKRDILPEGISRLVARKSEELDHMCLEVERDVLFLTIQVHKGPVTPQEASQFDTWFIVQTFRDILAREFNALDRLSDSKRSMARGAMYRKLKSVAYMPPEEMRRMMQQIMPGAVDSLEEDLGMLKEYASEIVADLAKNELMLPVEAHKIGYLTCTKVGREDIPWRAIQG
jgi:hypothetical protein